MCIIWMYVSWPVLAVAFEFLVERGPSLVCMVLALGVSYRGQLFEYKLGFVNIRTYIMVDKCVANKLNKIIIGWPH